MGFHGRAAPSNAEAQGRREDIFGNIVYVNTMESTIFENYVTVSILNEFVSIFFLNKFYYTHSVVLCDLVSFGREL